VDIAGFLSGESSVGWTEIHRVELETGRWIKVHIVKSF
jgi:hypothetical protein